VIGRCLLVATMVVVAVSTGADGQPRQAAQRSSSRLKAEVARVGSTCPSAKSGAVLKLVLSNVAPIPGVRAKPGVIVEVVSSFHDNQMTFPTAHPVRAVCEISQHRRHDGTALAVYTPLRKRTITFSSTYVHPTEAMMPAMLGRLVVG
jgi:hypothetical protein